MHGGQSLGAATAERSNYQCRGFTTFEDSAHGAWMSALFRFDLSGEARSDARTPAGIRIGDYDSHSSPFVLNAVTDLRGKTLHVF
jgi:hypothetical protein